MTEYFKKKYQRLLFDELRGEPRNARMWPGVVILKRDTIEFADNRILKFECAKVEKDEVGVSISAIDYPLLERLPKEVGELLEMRANP